MSDAQVIDRAQAHPGTGVTGPKALALIEPQMRWLETPREQLRKTLAGSLYPGAKPESVDMVLDYCEAARLNVMLKPVHIVPMNVKKAGTSNYEWRDVVMPGIQHYRTQADRSGTYLGISEPVYGPMVDGKWGNIEVKYPEWCKITVKRLVGSHVAEFTALEYWDENFATAGRDKPWPNTMWQKRARGQIAKCAEAQALRKAFPELAGAETAEEMEGKVIDLTAEDVTKPAAVKSLDQFAGGTASAQVVMDAADEAADRQSAGNEPEGAEVSQVEETGEVPVMPSDIAQPFYNPTEGAKPDWQPGWRWINETVESGKYTGLVKQALAEDHAKLLWAVHAVGGKQQKAVLAFVEKHGMVVPPPAAGGADAAAK